MRRFPAWLFGIGAVVVAVGLALGSAGCSKEESASASVNVDFDAAAAASKQVFVDRVQPVLAQNCAPCHVGKRFAFASLVRAGDDFTDEESDENFRTFSNLVSRDAPKKSRLLGKMLSDGDPDGVFHAAGAVATKSDEVYATTLDWIENNEKARCPQCGLSAPTAYLAYVEQPEIFWAIPSDPLRDDHGLRDRARIKLVRLDPATQRPTGDPIDFLGDGFCGADGRCDFGNLAVSHAGDRLAFECRLSLDQADWVKDVRWNICVAEIGPDGHAENPRFLRPDAQQNHGDSVARTDPFGLSTSGGEPLKGVYDDHFQTRRRTDLNPVFSPDDSRIYFASEQPDPRTGVQGTQTYHGFEHLNNIVAANVDGTDVRTIYVNEGGVADFPFFLKNGNVAFHTWNLERMDRHMYTQSNADGMMEIPVLLGRLQGPSMWGKATQLVNGGIFGMTGQRRSSVENYVTFFADHTLGMGVDTNNKSIKPLQILDMDTYNAIADFPDGYCNSPPDGPNCTTPKFYADPSYSPDGRAYVAQNPEKTYVMQGEDMYLNYSKGSGAAAVESMRAYVPKHMGISLMSHRGEVERVLDPPAGSALRYPAWVGRHDAPFKQPWKTDEAQKTVDLHIANVPLWFSFSHLSDSPDRSSDQTTFNSVVAMRVFVKELGGNYCLNDGLPYRYAVNAGYHDHPTHLGINNATGYTRLVAPTSAGGNDFGDVPIESDGSVLLHLPAGKLLLFQGIDEGGHAAAQHSRVMSLPPGQKIDTSVPRPEYESQCMSCHGTVDRAVKYLGLADTAKITYVPLDYTSQASQKAAADLTQKTEVTNFLATVRPLLDAHCVSCHSGAAPAGELSLEKDYSPTANFPAGKWATTKSLADPDYMASVPADKQVPGYNYSLTFAWDFRDDETSYQNNAAFKDKIASFAPLADLAPWDPAYQNLFAHNDNRFIYLSGYLDSNFGRADRPGGISKDSYLIEILTGKNLDPTQTFAGPDHTKFLSANEVEDIMAVLDIGFPFMARCDDKMVPSGPNAGKPWGEPGDLGR